MMEESRSGLGPVADEEERVGHWHSFIYVRVPQKRGLVKLAKRRCNTYVCSEALLKDAHISLSRPFWLWQHEIESFIAKLRSMIKHLPSFDLCILDEELRLPSDDGRTFLALRVQESAALRTLLAAIDAVLLDFGRSVYFENPIFHVSVAVLVDENNNEGDEPRTKRQRARLQAFVDTDSDESSSNNEDTPGNILMRAASIECKCGHRVFSIPLQR